METIGRQLLPRIQPHGRPPPSRSLNVIEDHSGTVPTPGHDSYDDSDETTFSVIFHRVSQIALVVPYSRAGARRPVLQAARRSCALLKTPNHRLSAAHPRYPIATINVDARTGAPAGTSVPRLTETELKELEGAVDYAVRSEGTLHEPSDWAHVGQLFAKYSQRILSELKQLRRKP